jgi:hypothetical protein
MPRFPVVLTMRNTVKAAIMKAIKATKKSPDAEYLD